MNGVLLGVLGYILVQFAIGAWVSRRISTESDYINAGRRIGPVLGAFTVFATWFGAEAIVGTSDAGLSSFERLSGGAPLLTDSERQFTYYNLGFGWNALPGEIFLGGERAYNSAVYLTLGAGSTRFAITASTE